MAGYRMLMSTGFPARRFLPCEEHATRIFIYATKYNYAKLANEAALSLCRKPDLEVVKQLPPAIIIPWVRDHFTFWLLSLAVYLATSGKTGINQRLYPFL
jgi:hypothetical protein